MQQQRFDSLPEDFVCPPFVVPWTKRINYLGTFICPGCGIELSYTPDPLPQSIVDHYLRCKCGQRFMLRQDNCSGSGEVIAVSQSFEIRDEKLGWRYI